MYYVQVVEVLIVYLNIVLLIFFPVIFVYFTILFISAQVIHVQNCIKCLETTTTTNCWSCVIRNHLSF